MTNERPFYTLTPSALYVSTDKRTMSAHYFIDMVPLKGKPTQKDLAAVNRALDTHATVTSTWDSATHTLVNHRILLIVGARRTEVLDALPRVVAGLSKDYAVSTDLQMSQLKDVEIL